MNNSFPSQETVERLRQQYPVGCEVELLRMDDVNAPPIGSIGVVTGVDSIGTIHVNWRCGSALGIAYGADLCRKVHHSEN